MQSPRAQGCIERSRNGRPINCRGATNRRNFGLWHRAFGVKRRRVETSQNLGPKKRWSSSNCRSLHAAIGAVDPFSSFLNLFVPFLSILAKRPLGLFPPSQSPVGRCIPVLCCLRVFKRPGRAKFLKHPQTQSDRFRGVIFLRNRRGVDELFLHIRIQYDLASMLGSSVLSHSPTGMRLKRHAAIGQV